MGPTRRHRLGLRRCSFVLFALACASGVRSQETPESPGSGDPAASELRAIFAEIESLGAVTVSVSHGVVNLGGTAPDPAAREDAERIAAKMSGVVFVQNTIELPATSADTAEASAETPTAKDQRIAEQIRAILSRVEDLKSVQVDVAAGVVELSGQVIRPDSIVKAETLAKSLDGVVFVSNRLEETTDISKRLWPGVDKVITQLRDLLFSIPLILVAVAVLLLVWWIARLAASATHVYERLSDNRLLQGILKQVVKTVIVLLGLYVALEIIGATALVGAVLGTAGVVGLALGFAFRDIVENYLASIILSLRQPFRSKDLVEIDGNLGTVIRMTTRETVLMTPEGNHLTMPNSTVFKGKILNYSQAPLRRFDVSIGVGTDVDLKLATKLGLDVLQEMAGVVDNPEPLARIENLGDSTVSICFYGWVHQHEADFGKVKSESIRLIKTVLDESGIDMPVPTYAVDLRRGSEPAPKKPAKAAEKMIRTEAQSIDVTPERHVEEQVEAELRESNEPDLLTEDEPVVEASPATTAPSSTGSDSTA